MFFLYQVGKVFLRVQPDVLEMKVITQSISSATKFYTFYTNVRSTKTIQKSKSPLNIGFVWYRSPWFKLLSWKKTYIGQIPLISIFTKPFHPPLTSKMMTCFPCLDPSERFRRRPAHPLHVKSSSIWPTVPSSKGSRSKPETHTQRFLKMPKELKLTLDNFQFFIGTFTYFKQKVGKCVRIGKYSSPVGQDCFKLYLVW